jgi:hypothetical protein
MGEREDDLLDDILSETNHITKVTPMPPTVGRNSVSWHASGQGSPNVSYVKQLKVVMFVFF